MHRDTEVVDQPAMRLGTERLLVRDLAAADLEAGQVIFDLDLRVDDCSRDDWALWLQWTVLDHEQRQWLHRPRTANTRPLATQGGYGCSSTAGRTG